MMRHTNDDGLGRDIGDDELMRHADDDEVMQRTGDDELPQHTDDDPIEEPAQEFERLADDPEAVTAQTSRTDEVRRMAERSEAARSGEEELAQAVESEQEQGRYWEQP